MKLLRVLACLMLMPAAVSAAGAQTITFAPIGCGTLKQCINVPNDAAADVDMYFAPSYSWLNLYIAGVRYYSPTGNGATITNVPLTAQDGSGTVVILSAQFATYRTCTHSGRGQTCTTHWNLLSGNLQQ
jgi:hypothetical protein